MREILFKAKRIDNGEWVEGGYAYTFNEEKTCHIVGVMVENHWIIEKSGNIVIVDKDTICQYTGLTDKNSNKIWENDILIYDNSPYNVYCTPHKGEIVCRNGCLCFKYWLYGSTNYMPFTADVFFDKKSEVIGNVFDNAELLNI